MSIPHTNFHPFQSDPRYSSPRIPIHALSHPIPHPCIIFYPALSFLLLTEPIPKRGGKTHARELDAAVTALHRGALLLDVKVPELAAGSLDDADLVALGVVPVGRDIRSEYGPRVRSFAGIRRSWVSSVELTGCAASVIREKNSVSSQSSSNLQHFRQHLRLARKTRTYCNLVSAILSAGCLSDGGDYFVRRGGAGWAVVRSLVVSRESRISSGVACQPVGRLVWDCDCEFRRTVPLLLWR